MLNFNFKFVNPTTGTFAVDDDLIILRMETVSPTTNNTLFFQLTARYVGTNNWKPVFINDKGYVDVPAINLVTQNWWVTAALSSTNNIVAGTVPAVPQQTGRINTNSNGATYKVQLDVSETWDFTTSVRLKYFAVDVVSSYYFSGQVGRIDYVGGQYETSASSTNDDYVLEWKLPCIFENNS